MVFRNRNEAAEQLAENLARYAKDQPLVLGIPRGSVPMAKLIADRLHGELDVVLTHKIGAPDNPEFAIGSVSEFGTLYRSVGLEYFEISTVELQALAQAEIAKLKKRREMISPLRHPVSPTQRTVILVDDGIATGATMIAAIRAIRSQRPNKIVVAAPVASLDAVELLRPEADALVFLDMPADFFAISQFYEDFPQVSDKDVETILTEAERSKPERAA